MKTAVWKISLNFLMTEKIYKKLSEGNIFFKNSDVKIDRVVIFLGKKYYSYSFSFKLFGSKKRQEIIVKIIERTIIQKFLEEKENLSFFERIPLNIVNFFWGTKQIFKMEIKNGA